MPIIKKKKINKKNLTSTRYIQYKGGIIASTRRNKSTKSINTKLIKSRKQILKGIDKINNDIYSYNLNSGIHKIALSLCHGKITNGVTIVPENIFLIQYTAPPLLLGPIDTFFINNYIGKVNDKREMIIMPPYLEDNVDNNIVFEPDGFFTSHKPLTTTQNLKLRFEEENTGMALFGKHLGTRIQDPDGLISYCTHCEVITDLSDLLSVISEKFSTKYPGKIIPLLQLSCREQNEFDIVPHRSEIKKNYFYRMKQRYFRTYDIWDVYLTKVKDPEHISIQEYADYLPWVSRNYTEIYGRNKLSNENQFLNMDISSS